VLREPVVEDAAAVAAACIDPEIQRWLPLPDPYTEDDARMFLRELVPAQRLGGTGIVLAIDVDVDDRLAGLIDLKSTDWRGRTTEIGYWAAPWARGRGVMRSAVRTLTDWTLHEQGFVRVEIRVATGNLASQRVAESSGYTREGVLRSAGFVHAGRVDMVVYSRLDTDPPLPT